MPEVGTGIPNNERPSLNAAIKEHLRGQALTVARLCERELCETLRRAFLGERKSVKQDSLATGVDNEVMVRMAGGSQQYNDGDRNGANRKSIGHISALPLLEAYIEILDYVGGNDFHGFVAQKGTERGLFVFLGEELLHKDLKAGLVCAAILEVFCTNVLTYGLTGSLRYSSWLAVRRWRSRRSWLVLIGSCLQLIFNRSLEISDGLGSK